MRRGFGEFAFRVPVFFFFSILVLEMQETSLIIVTL